MLQLQSSLSGFGTEGEVDARSVMILTVSSLVNGTAVNPVEWWDMKWMQDRVFRKIMEAGGSVT